MASKLKRVLYKRLVDGDRRKIIAQSNDADTGGGARDLRFNPWPKFEPVVHRLMPKTATRKTSRGDVTVRVGELGWYGEGGSRRSVDVEFWPPTDARPNEGRLARVHEIPPFAASQIPSVGPGESVFYLIWEDEEGIWGRYVSEGELRSGNWHQQVAKPVLDALAEAQSEGKENARGYIDLEAGRTEAFYA